MHRTPLSAALLLILASSLLLAEPVTREEADRQAKVLAAFQAALAAVPDATVKFAAIAKAMRAEQNVDVRWKMIDAAAAIPGPEIEPLLVEVMAGDDDAGIRSRAATLLGERGSPDCLAALDRAAGNDKVTDLRRGDIVGAGSARRAATFALAELARRHPQIAERAIAQLRVQPGPENVPHGEELADVRIQALYQITGDKELLKPFFARLQSPESKVRERGVVAFRALKLKEAPEALTATLTDGDENVRRWAALVLGEIGDAKTAAELLKAAENEEEDIFVRCNALRALGKMKAASAADAVEKLAGDANPQISAAAAIALYRITGKKVKQFPAGYLAD